MSIGRPLQIFPFLISVRMLSCWVKHVRRQFFPMKFSTLKAIAHNMADSVGSGIGLMVGVYEMDIYGEAAASSDRYIEVDFLTGETSGGRCSAGLVKALTLYRDALPEFCQRHGVDAHDFRELTVRFSGTHVRTGFTVTVEDQQGRRSVDTYEGIPGKRVRVLDRLGRIRRT